MRLGYVFDTYCGWLVRHGLGRRRPEVRRPRQAAPDRAVELAIALQATGFPILVAVTDGKTTPIAYGPAAADQIDVRRAALRS